MQKVNIITQEDAAEIENCIMHLNDVCTRLYDNGCDANVASSLSDKMATAIDTIRTISCGTHRFISINILPVKTK